MGERNREQVGVHQIGNEAGQKAGDLGDVSRFTPLVGIKAFHVHGRWAIVPRLV